MSPKRLRISLVVISDELVNMAGSLRIDWRSSGTLSESHQLVSEERLCE